MSTRRYDRAGVARGITKGYCLAPILQGWQRRPKTWFTGSIVECFAWLPTYFWEDPAAFATGALRVVNRLLQDRTGSAISPVDSTSKTVYQSPTRLTVKMLDLDFVDLRLRLNLHKPDQLILRDFNALVKSVRVWRDYPSAFNRPVSVAQIQRDYVAYVLWREGWRNLHDIDLQLDVMGCIPLPARSDPKSAMRRLVRRFELIQQEIADSSPEWRRNIRFLSKKYQANNLSGHIIRAEDVD